MFLIHIKSKHVTCKTICLNNLLIYFCSRARISPQTSVNWNLLHVCLFKSFFSTKLLFLIISNVTYLIYQTQENNNSKTARRKCIKYEKQAVLYQKQNILSHLFLKENGREYWNDCTVSRWNYLVDFCGWYW